MDSTSNPDPSQPQGANQQEGTSNSQASSREGRCLFEPLRTAMNEGAHRAKVAAEEAIPKVKSAISDATYWFGYGVSFATVFSYTIMKELAPEVSKGGCRDGAQAGQKTAEDLAARFNAQPEAQGATPSPGPDPSGRAPEPSVG